MNEDVMTAILLSCVLLAWGTVAFLLWQLHQTKQSVVKRDKAIDDKDKIIRGLIKQINETKDSQIEKIKKVKSDDTPEMAEKKKEATKALLKELFGGVKLPTAKSADDDWVEVLEDK